MNTATGYVRSWWREFVHGALATMQEAVVYFSEPERLLRRPEYRKRPDWSWLTSFLDSLQSAQHRLRVATKFGIGTSEERHRLDELVLTAREGLARHLAWVQEQLRLELQELVQKYQSAYWVEAIEDGMPHEFWYVLSQRSAIEAHLRAPQLLHPSLVPDPELVQRVEETDMLLRRVGRRLWEIDAPTGGEETKRELFHPRDHWWWWMDKDSPEG